MLVVRAVGRFDSAWGYCRLEGLGCCRDCSDCLRLVGFEASLENRFKANLAAAQFLKRFHEELFVALQGGEMVVVRAGDAKGSINNVNDSALAEDGAYADLRLPYFTDPLLPEVIRLLDAYRG